MYGQYKETVGEWYNSRFTNNTNNNNNTGLSKNRTLPLYAQLIGTVFAGTIGAIVSCPTDVVLIRMQADGRLPLEQRRNYSNVLVGLTRVAREEGVSALYRGVASNIYRASIVTSCQLVSYDAAKNFLLNSPLLHTKLELKLKDNIVTHFFSGIFAGIVTTLIASPVDIIRTRYMNSMDEFLKKQNQSSAIQFYRSPIDCVVKTVRTEGFLALYKGSFVYCLRVMPHVTSMFLLVEGSNRVIDRVRALL